jgi:hypothetical protein
MKKVVIFIMLAISIVSCTKEEDKPCNCGTILNDGINGSCYWLEIENDCTGNRKSFCFDQSVWMSSYVGSNFCVSNQPQW